MKTVSKSRRTVVNNGDSDREQHLTIPAPRFETARFKIRGMAPLVICRFSTEARGAIADKHAEGSTAGSKRTKKKVTVQEAYEASIYHSKQGGWEGFHASAIRNGMISACRLVNFKMVLAKLSVFVVPDGWDKDEPQIPLIRIHGKSFPQTDHVRNRNSGQFSVCTRAAYLTWEAEPTIRWDADQFTLQDVANLLARVGQQVGIGCGRPDSKESAGMNWGLFNVVAE